MKAVKIIIPGLTERHLILSGSRLLIKIGEETLVDAAASEF